VRSVTDPRFICLKLTVAGLANSGRCFRLKGYKRDSNASPTHAGRKTSDLSTSCLSADSRQRVLSRFIAQYSRQMSYNVCGELAGHNDSCISTVNCFTQNSVLISSDCKLFCCTMQPEKTLIFMPSSHLYHLYSGY